MIDEKDIREMTAEELNRWFTDTQQAELSQLLDSLADGEQDREAAEYVLAHYCESDFDSLDDSNVHNWLAERLFRIIKGHPPLETLQMKRKKGQRRHKTDDAPLDVNVVTHELKHRRQNYHGARFVVEQFLSIDASTSGLDEQMIDWLQNAMAKILDGTDPIRALQLSEGPGRPQAPRKLIANFVQLQIAKGISKSEAMESAWHEFGWSYDTVEDAVRTEVVFAPRSRDEVETAKQRVAQQREAWHKQKRSESD